MSEVVNQNHRFTVLLANEQEGWHQIVRQLLEPQGVETVSARSGREALDIIEHRPIHVAVLDAQMPQLGGLQVIKMLRELQKRGGAFNHRVPPAILLANQLTSHLLHEALGMHVFSVLSKPIDFNVLLDTLARVLRRHYENKWPAEQSEQSSEGTTITIDASAEPEAAASGNGNGNGNGHRNGNGRHVWRSH